MQKEKRKKRRKALCTPKLEKKLKNSKTQKLKTPT